MKYKNYIVSFAAGSSGRFVKALLDRIIKNSEEPILLDQRNSAHDNLIPIDYDISLKNWDVHHPDIFKYLNFLGSHSIFTTHTYPNFELINSKFSDVGIILIQYDISDCIEVTINSLIKNKKIENISDILIPKVKFELIQSVTIKTKKDKFFIYDPNLQNEKCLVLKYNEIYQKTGDSYVVIDKLKEFSQSSYIPKSAMDACDSYSMGRNNLLKQAGLR